MPDFGRKGPDRDSGPESLEDIARTDMLLDALSQQRRIRPADRADAELFALLEGWRDDVRIPRSTHVVSEDQAFEALHEGLTARQPQKTAPRRGLTLVATLAAAVLGIGGFGALVGGAQPGDAMYGLRTALFGEAQSLRDDRVTLAAQTEMAEVQKLIESGDWEQAQAKLQEVSGSVESVGNVEAKTDLIQQWNELSVKVGTRDPNATVPVVVPGEPAPAPPPGVTLLELPPVTTPSPPEPATTTSGELPPATTTSGEPATTTTSGEPTTTEPAVPPSSVQTTTPTTTTAPTTPTTTTTTTTTPTTTTPTTTAPTTTTTTSEAVRQVPATSATVTATSVAPAVEIPPSSMPSVPSAAAVPSESVAPSVSVPSVAETPEPVPTSGNSITTTTMPRQVIQLPIPGFS